MKSSSPRFESILALGGQTVRWALLLCASSGSPELPALDESAGSLGCGRATAMKRIGLLGGMSWESSAEYYRLLNDAVRDRLGGLHSADCVMHSIDFTTVEVLQREDRWDEAARLLTVHAEGLERAGAQCLVLCTNTMHKVADEIQAGITIPLLHIADATAHRIHGAGIGRVGLLATRYTMAQDFYRGRLAARHNLEVVVPPEPDLTLVHNVIYDELCQGRILDASREQYRRIIAGLETAGVEGIIYGCTEIDLLVGPEDAAVPVFDTTRIHVDTATDWALG
jgi:aspartate racemase